MRKLLLVGALSLFSVNTMATQSKANKTAPFNELILQIMRKMPSHGGYSTNALAFTNLSNAIKVESNTLKVQADIAQPSFCSASTYLVFTQVLSELQKQGTLQLSSSDWQSFQVSDPKTQPDGDGVWGRWNANGPGTARLFSELRLGTNFTRLEDAIPGDFLKIFWSDEIGAKEKGHSVIFTGIKNDSTGRQICYWSSNLPYDGEPKGGMGEKCSDEKKIHRMLFSRLMTPESLQTSLKEISNKSSKYTDSYLHGLLKMASTPEEMCTKVHCVR